MNERIEQLASQAGMLRDKYGLYWNAHDNPDDGVDLEKFTELIVRECIDWCNANARDDGTAQRIAEDIKKDFGVKE
jgi:hypothetical protein